LHIANIQPALLIVNPKIEAGGRWPQTHKKAHKIPRLPHETAPDPRKNTRVNRPRIAENRQKPPNTAKNRGALSPNPPRRYSRVRIS
jgi:hypothetical protein